MTILELVYIIHTGKAIDVFGDLKAFRYARMIFETILPQAFLLNQYLRPHRIVTKTNIDSLHKFRVEKESGVAISYQ